MMDPGVINISDNQSQLNTAFERTGDDWVSEGDIYMIKLPKSLVAEALKKGFDIETLVVDALIEKLNLDPGEEAATRIEFAEYFLEEAKKYIETGDTVQASEKLYRVAEECIKTLAVKFKVPEVDEARREGRWWAKLLAKASRALSALLNDLMIRYAWEDAYDLHVWGFYEVVYSIEHVKMSLPTIEQLVAKTKELAK